MSEETPAESHAPTRPPRLKGLHTFDLTASSSGVEHVVGRDKSGEREVSLSHDSVLEHFGMPPRPADSLISPEVPDAGTVEADSVAKWQTQGHNPVTGEIIQRRINPQSPSGYDIRRIPAPQSVEAVMVQAPENPVPTGPVAMETISTPQELPAPAETLTAESEGVEEGVEAPAEVGWVNRQPEPPQPEPPPLAEPQFQKWWVNTDKALTTKEGDNLGSKILKRSARTGLWLGTGLFVFSIGFFPTIGYLTYRQIKRRMSHNN